MGSNTKYRSTSLTRLPIHRDLPRFDARHCKASKTNTKQPIMIINGSNAATLSPNRHLPWTCTAVQAQ
jgi:hypothetical protein